MSNRELSTIDEENGSFYYENESVITFSDEYQEIQFG